MQALEPKHTLSSVIERLLDGLDDGTVLLEPAEWKLFPNLAQELREGISYTDLRRLTAESMATFLGQASRLQARFSDVADGLESLIRLARELRFTPKRMLAQDLGWYMRVIVSQILILPDLEGEADKAHRSISEATRLEKMMEIAVEEQSSIIEELSIQLQISLAELLKSVLEIAASSIYKRSVPLIKKMWPDDPAVPSALQHKLGQALTRSGPRRMEEVELLIQTLQMALTRAQATIPVQAAAVQDRTRSAG